MKGSWLFFAALGLVANSLGSSIIDRGSDILSALASQLSPGASIILPDDPLFSSRHQRWSAYSSPTYSVVVEVATEKDVEIVVRFANHHSLPFLAVDGAHGSISTLGQMQGGIAISFKRMKGIQISAAGDHAELQPGLTNGDLIRYLWAHGKQTVTGNCLCTGIMGIMLGGGHGYVQGLFGLLADQILEARVVLADGSSVTASQSSNRNLFYALRGAGHNFGIVTGLKYKVYDRIESWSEINLIFIHDKLEQVFELANSYLSTADHPPELIMWFTFMRRPDIDPSHAIINMRMIYAGPVSNLEPFAAPFRALSPAQDFSYPSVAYPDLFTLNRNDEDSPATCGKGLYRHLMPNYLARHNTTSLRTVHTLFDDITAQYPNIAFNSAYVIESYSQQAVVAVPGHETATPYREYPILTTPVWGYDNLSYSADIIATSKAIRKALVEGSGSGQPLRAYVNYAFGDETTAELYGHEPWRVPRLRALKRQYDPENRFRFYAGIDPAGPYSV